MNGLTAGLSHTQRVNHCAMELAVRLRRGDEAALGEALRVCGAGVAIVVRRCYPSLTNEDVEDVLSLALVGLWNARERIEPSERSVWRLFCRIALRTTRDVFRHGWHKARQLEVPLEVSVGSSSEGKCESGGSVPVLPAHAATDLWRIIDALPDAYRYILLADAYARDRVASAEMLGRELDLPPGTVRVYRTRAMKAIRAEMRKLGYEVP